MEFVRGTCWVITPCNSWSTEAKSRLCSRMSKHLAWGSCLTVLTTKIWLSKPRVREGYTTSFMHIFDTNKVPWVVLQFLWTGTHLGEKRNQRTTRARHCPTTRHGRPSPARARHCRTTRHGLPRVHNLDERHWSRKRRFDRMDEVMITWINGSTSRADQPPQPSFQDHPERHQAA
jgi:hypothetical protein